MPNMFHALCIASILDAMCQTMQVSKNTVPSLSLFSFAVLGRCTDIQIRQLSEISFLLRFALQKHPILFLKKQKEPIKPKNAIEQNKQPFVMSSMGYQHLTITNASLAAKNHKKNTC